MDRNKLRVGQKLVCKKAFLYNGHFKKGDIFTIYHLNHDKNAVLTTPLYSRVIIPYKKVSYSKINLDDLFYTYSETLKMKLDKIKRYKGLK